MIGPPGERNVHINGEGVRLHDALVPGGGSPT